MNTQCYIGGTSTATGGAAQGYRAMCGLAPVRRGVPGGAGAAAVAWNTLSLMMTGPGRAARDLLLAADEALTEAAFCTGEFAAAERLFGAAQAEAARDRDQEAEARAVGGLGMTHHYRNIVTLVGGQAPADVD